MFIIPLQPQIEITSQNNNTLLNVTNGAESEQVRANETIPVTSDARISVNVSDTEGGEIIGDRYYIRGDAVILYAIEQEGYKFLGWYDENNQLEATSSLYEFTAQKDRTLSPKFIQQLNSFTNYTPRLYNGYDELCTVEVRQEDKNVTVSLEWLKNQNIIPTVYMAIYDDNGKMTELIPFEITKTETGIIYSATVTEGNGTLFMLDGHQNPILEAYTNN